MNKKQLYESIMTEVSKQVKKALNESYPEDVPMVGDIIKIIHMDDNNGEDVQASKYNDRTGTITHIDDLGQLHGSWGSLAIIPGTDEYEIIGKNENYD